jgi:hypothetical protein
LKQKNIDINKLNIINSNKSDVILKLSRSAINDNNATVSLSVPNSFPEGLHTFFIEYKEEQNEIMIKIPVRVLIIP